MNILRMNLASIPLACFEKERVDINILHRRIVVVASPAAMSEILGDDGTTFRLSQLQRRLLQPVLGEGLVMAEGASWRAQRRMAQPLLGAPAPDALRAAVGHVDALADGWIARGGTGDLLADLSAASLNALTSCMFGHAAAVATPERAEALSQRRRLMARVDLLDLLGAPMWLGGRRMRAVSAAAHVADAAVAAAARAAPPLHAAAARMSDARLRDFALSLLSGHESIALTAFWALMRLDDWRDEAALAAEAPAISFSGPRPPALAALERVIAETMRLYPPFPFLFRVATRRTVTAVGPLGRGALVCASPYVMHRHRRHWTAPERFDPGRFVAAPPAAYMPYGVGARRCPATRLGEFMAAMMLQRILKRFRVTPPAAPPQPCGGVSLRPDRPCAITVAPRRARRRDAALEPVR
jgi:cytochrome P450